MQFFTPCRNGGHREKSDLVRVTKVSSKNGNPQLAISLPPQLLHELRWIPGDKIAVGEDCGAMILVRNATGYTLSGRKNNKRSELARADIRLTLSDDVNGALGHLIGYGFKAVILPDGLSIQVGDKTAAK